MNKVTYKFDISKENKQFLDSGLEAYNFSKNAYLNPKIYNEKSRKKFGFYAYSNDRLIGGAYGFMDDGYWTFLELLFVDENYRNMDIATNLMKQVEAFAKENHCMGVRTETWSFQARGFYEKNGFTVYGELKNHPPKATLYFLKKDLITKEEDFPKLVK